MKFQKKKKKIWKQIAGLAWQAHIIDYTLTSLEQVVCEVPQQRQEHQKKKKWAPGAVAMPHKINDRGHVYGCSHRRFCCKRCEKWITTLMWVHCVYFSWWKKTKHPHWQTWDYSPSERRSLEIPASKKRALKLFWNFYHHVFLWLFLWRGDGGGGGGFIQDFLFPKTSLLTEHNMISLASYAAVPSSLPRMKFWTCSHRDRTSCILPLWRNLKAAMNNLSIWGEST